MKYREHVTIVFNYQNIKYILVNVSIRIMNEPDVKINNQNFLEYDESLLFSTISISLINFISVVLFWDPNLSNFVCSPSS